MLEIAQNAMGGIMPAMPPFKDWLDDRLSRRPRGSGAELARLLDKPPDVVTKMRKGDRRPQANEIPIIETFLGERSPLSVAEIIAEQADGAARAAEMAPPANARFGEASPLAVTVPAYGHAVGGRDGQFVLNGNRIADILAPSSLRGVPDAYAVYVVGNSMENRYYAGEAVFVNPRLPVRRGDFVVAQIAGEDGAPPDAYVKRFVSKEAKVLRLEQLNPRKILTFPVKRLVAIHRIIMSGDG